MTWLSYTRFRSVSSTMVVCLILAASSFGQTVGSAPIALNGKVIAGNTPVPGATVTITQPNQEKITTWTDINGYYWVAVPTSGHYQVRAEMMGFGGQSQAVEVGTAGTTANFSLVLASRTENAEATTGQAVGRPLPNFARQSRGFQNLALLQAEASGDTGTNSANDRVVPAGMPVPGLAPNAATESVTVSGNMSSASTFGMSTDEMQQRMREAGEQQGGFGRDNPSGRMFGGPFGGGGGFGAGGGPRGGRAFVLGGGRGRFDINRPHGSVYYTVGDSALDATPYSLTGAPTPKPSFLQQRFGASIGGPMNIPKIYKGGTKTFFFANYNGSRSQNPFDAFSTVPTLLERAGNFSQTVLQTGQNASTPVQIFEPTTNTPFPQNRISNINSAAQALLQYIPLPNLPGSVQNFHYVTSATQDSDDLNLRLMHALGAGGIGRGRRGGPRNNLTFGFHYHSANNVLTNPFPSIGGKTSTRSFDVPVGYVRSFGKLTNIARFDFNRSRTSTRNLYAFLQNIGGALGIAGTSANPFDWGLPNLSFTDLGSLNDINPQLIRNQTLTFSDNLIWNHGKHTLRWGGDFRRIQLNTEASNDARGTFVFTGRNTAQIGPNGQPVPNTGFDFADFLLGLPQQTRLQSTEPGANHYHFRGNSWDLYAQDEWRLRANVTLNLGLRYEYVSPFTELNNRIANLYFASNLSTATVVVPGQLGFPVMLVRPDRNNFAPRVGIAWKALPKTVVRAGYGINYNTGAYQTIAQQLAFQPPFATTFTNVQTGAGRLTLQNGFPMTSANQSLVTNNYAVDPNYRLGYVQIWNFDVQQEITPALILNLDCTGTKGTRLDVLQDPNRTLTGTLIGDVQAFNWQTSQADSSANAGTVRLRKRLQHGISVGGSYTFSKAIDNASSIGGGATVVAQNPFDLAAERGLSSFDQRHRFTADYLLELTFGHDKRWLSSKTALRALFGDWQWSGDWTIASGLPFTPRVLGNFSDVNRGTNGTLRADVVPGAAVSLPDPSINAWFNTAAFVVPPAGQYGDARRNSIEGPGSRLFDMAFTKVFPLAETRTIEFRAQITNIFNTAQFTAIDTVLNSPTFGHVISVGQMRTTQLTARFRF